MSEFSELAVLFHAWGLESRFYNTKICSIIKGLAGKSITKEEFIQKVPLPGQEFRTRAMQELEQAKALGVCSITILDKEYPKMLAEIDDPPIILFVMTKRKCDSSLFEDLNHCYGIVGARRATIYGESTTKALAKGLSDLGLTVVSGLAVGIDSRAHFGALHGSADVPTIAVLGSGLFQLYPKSNSILAEDILDKGGYILSEYGLGEVSRTHLFPRRNRIISALSRGVIVVEAEERSGSLITARLALEQGREVYSVPGPIDSPTSSGTNKLISDGANMVLSVDSFLKEIKSKYKIKRKKLVSLSSKIEVLGGDEEIVLSTLRNKVFSFDELLYETKLTYSDLRLAIARLVLADLVVEKEGVFFKC